MASSTIGMADLPYKDIPFSTDGSDLKLHTIPASVSFKHSVTLISGVRTEDDVMRGEETKLIGCTVGVSNKNNHLFIFPGTHPKHVHVKNDKATAFKTYMTGEFFDLLSTKSILSVSWQKEKVFKKQTMCKRLKKV
jgi:2-dehydro-3-deoxygalactonokinase